MIDPTTISFPGIGIGEFTVDKVAFSIGKLEVRWYGVFITLGIICAFIVAYLHTRDDGLVPDDLLDIGLVSVIAGIVGARLYYVITSASSGRDTYNSFLDVIAVWNGGLAIYGGVIGGCLAVYLMCRYKKINWQKLLDAIVPGIMIAQVIGRWGNFINGEAHGGIVMEGSPLYFLRMGLYEGGTFACYHPTFFYESLWNLIGFVLIQVFYKKKKFDGQILLEYVTWYGFGRMFIEGLRTDSLYLGHTGIRVSQLVGFLCFLIGGGLLAAGLIAAKKGKLCVADNVYYPGAKRLLLQEKERFVEEAIAEKAAREAAANAEHEDGADGASETDDADADKADGQEMEQTDADAVTSDVNEKDPATKTADTTSGKPESAETEEATADKDADKASEETNDDTKKDESNHG